MPVGQILGFLCVALMLAACSERETGPLPIWRDYDTWPPENAEEILHATMDEYLTAPGGYDDGTNITFMTNGEPPHDWGLVEPDFWTQCRDTLEVRSVEDRGAILWTSYWCVIDGELWQSKVCIYNRFDPERREQALGNKFRRLIMRKYGPVEAIDRMPVGLGGCAFNVL